MINCIRTDTANKDFILLVSELDAELKQRDGEEHGFYAQFNKVDTIKNVIIAYYNSLPAGCGAFKEYSGGTAEVKRMFVQPGMRRMGIAAAVLNGLEEWAKELNYKRCILETGEKQPEAISLYIKSGYIQIPNYGQYKNIANSRCFRKNLI